MSEIFIGSNNVNSASSNSLVKDSSVILVEDIQLSNPDELIHNGYGLLAEVFNDLLNLQKIDGQISMVKHSPSLKDLLYKGEMLTLYVLNQHTGYMSNCSSPKFFDEFDISQYKQFEEINPYEVSKGTVLPQNNFSYLLASTQRLYGYLMGLNLFITHVDFFNNCVLPIALKVNSYFKSMQFCYDLLDMKYEYWNGATIVTTTISDVVSYREIVAIYKKMCGVDEQNTFSFLEEDIRFFASLSKDSLERFSFANINPLLKNLTRYINQYREQDYPIVKEHFAPFGEIFMKHLVVINNLNSLFFSFVSDDRRYTVKNCEPVILSDREIEKFFDSTMIDGEKVVYDFSLFYNLIVWLSGSVVFLKQALTKEDFEKYRYLGMEKELESIRRILVYQIYKSRKVQNN